VSTCAGKTSFGTQLECEAVCATYPSGAATDVNTLECREAYATAAAGGADVDTNCYYATSHGGGRCGTICQVSFIVCLFVSLCHLITHVYTYVYLLIGLL
jgi:hypothetical protein